MTVSLVGCSTERGSQSSPDESIPSETMRPTESESISESLPAFDEFRVRLSFEGGEAIVQLTDNAAARDFVSQLPMTQTFEDFNSIEKICRLPNELTTEGVEAGVDPDIADVTLYVPWNTLVFYYDDYGYNDDLIPIGHVESGMDLLAAMGDEFEVTMELLGEEASENQNAEHLEESTNITMTVGETVITAELDDSETTRAFLQTLPRTLT